MLSRGDRTEGRPRQRPLETTNVPGIRDLRDKVVVITGAGSGIGRATAGQFAAAGARLFLADLSAERLAQVAAELGPRAAAVETQVCDVGERDEVQALARATLERYGRVDVVHNNAGVALAMSVAETTLADWQWITRVNYWGVIYGVEAFLPHLMAQRSGHIVNTASVMGLCATPNTGAYCATKHAIVGLSEALRAELREHNVGVTAVCPGVIQTRVIEAARIRTRPGAKAERAWIEDLYRQRGWPPERVGRAVVAAVRRDRAVVPVGPEAWLGWWFYRASPALYRRAIGWLYGRLM